MMSGKRRWKGPALIFVRGPGTFKGETRLLLYIDGKHVSAPATNVKLLAYLHARLGLVIPFERLLLQLGIPNARERDRHILRQYVTWMRQFLVEHDTRYCLAVARNFGYALCEIAPTRGRK